jgi:hypothetical protein
MVALASVAMREADYRRVGEVGTANTPLAASRPELAAAVFAAGARQSDSVVTNRTSEKFVMRRFASCAIAFVVAWGSSHAPIARAQENMAQDAPASATITSVADDYGADCCEPCYAGGHAYGEIQYVSLKTYSDVGIFTGSDNEGGFRAIAGYETCSGAGLRVRYFDYDGVVDDPLFGPLGLATQSLDIEATHTLCVCDIDGVVSVGYRHTEYDVSVGIIPPFGEFNFSGDGLTFGLQFDWAVYGDLSLYAWGQQSFVFGEVDGILLGEDMLGQLSEAQVAAQYTACVGGYAAFVRAGAEAQYHDGMLAAASTGLWGWFVSVGVGY